MEGGGKSLQAFFFFFNEIENKVKQPPTKVGNAQNTRNFEKLIQMKCY